MNKRPIHLGWCDVFDRADQLAERLRDTYKGSLRIRLYGVKPDGVYASLAVMGRCVSDFIVVEDPLQADVVVDGVIYSGTPRNVQEYCTAQLFPRPFVALVNMTDKDAAWDGHPVVFPWYRDQLLQSMLEYQMKQFDKETYGRPDQPRDVSSCSGERTGRTQPA